MLIQHFVMKTRPVPDPMRPGRTARVGYLTASGNSGYGYTDPHTKEDVWAEPDANGWIEVPHEVGLHACRFRDRGSGFYSPEEIDDSVRLGVYDGAPPAADNKSKTTRRRRPAPGEPDPNEPGDIVGPDD